ncbi:MAG TPA: hypothetical protein VFH75_01760 [Actinomycetota bacterium]|nr:hypothetical protein [Actinomycetota bacterium]
MTVDERRHQLQRKLEEVLGPQNAQTLMDELGTGRLTIEDLRSELRTRLTQLDTKLQLLEERTDRKLSELKSDILERINDQTKTLFRAAVVSNAATVLAVAGLAFGAARLA